jgi:DNA-binding protein Alba
MMTSIVQESTAPASTIRVIPPSVLLIGKKHPINYIAPGLYRLNNTGELIIKATGSLSIVTAVDVAEMIKRDMENVLASTISLGTDSLIVSSGESKRMSCIEIRLSKVIPAPDLPAPVEIAIPVPDIPVPTTKAPAAKKTRARKKASTTAKKKKVVRKRKASA